MDSESTISPFVFVDGRKYVLAETEELPEPAILGKLTPPPRNVAPAVRWRLFLCCEGELLGVAGFSGAFFCVGTMFIVGGDFGAFASMMMGLCLTLLPLFIICASRVYTGMRTSANVIQFLQDGLVSKGRFYGICPTGKKMHATGKMNSANYVPEIELQYQFTTQDGNTRNASVIVTNTASLIYLSDASLKLIFYDPAQPNRNLLFETLPRGIDFDEPNGTFCTHPVFLVSQIFWLCIVFSIIPAITLAVAVFLC